MLVDDLLWSASGALVAGAACARWCAVRGRAEIARLRWAAEHDHLTRLPNRAGVQRRYETNRAAGRPDTVIIVDLDGFKLVNDTFGHHVGDQLLAAVADRLAGACGSAGFAARLGGDEFVLLLPAYISPQAMDTILAGLLAPVAVAGQTLTPAASIGVAPANGGRAWGPQLRCADIALYHAKEDGRSAVIYQDGMLHPRTAAPSPAVPSPPVPAPTMPTLSEPGWYRQPA
jgi:diguanylate cyclase (GGDEF)-like protein